MEKTYQETINNAVIHNALSPIREKNLYRKSKNLVRRFQKRGLGFIRHNDKTMISLDISNECPREKAGNPCAYCYKRDLYRLYGKTGFEQGKEYQKGPVCIETLGKFCYELKKLLKQYDNPGFSIRLFSMGDITEQAIPFWRAVLPVFRQYKIRVHAITKQFDLIPRIADLLDKVNLSVDSIGSTDINQARALKAGNPGKYLIRSVILNNADLWLGHETDIVTIFHGDKVNGIETYDTSNNPRAHNNYRKFIQKLDNELFHGKVCCTKNGTCINCKRCQ